MNLNNTHCKNCHYYIEHYGFDDNRIYRVFCGHCTFLRVRHKHPDAPACENYLPGTPDEDRFVTKEYLSKKLLDHILSLDILPPIK